MEKYLSLVAHSGQVNTPPGSYCTVKEWITHSFLDASSRVLEVGCSTGFITIEIARYTHATCVGLDAHKASIKTARNNTDSHIKDCVSFVEGNAGRLPFKTEFSHVVIGGHLPFVPATVRKAHIKQAVRVTKPWGYVLTALYYYKEPPPITLLAEFNREVGTKLDPNCDFAYWTSLFEGQNLQMEYESVYDVLPADSNRTSEYLAHLDQASRKRWHRRLELFNQNGRFLQYFVRVYRRVPEEVGLMIQVPRGGIYRTKRISQQSF